MVKIGVDLYSLMLHIGGLKSFFEADESKRAGILDARMDTAHNDLKAICRIIETGIKNNGLEINS